MKSKSIRYYFFTSIATVLIASVLVMGLIQSLIAMAYFREEKQTMLAQVTQTVADGVRGGRLDLDNDALRSLGYMAQIADAMVFVTNMSGTVLFTSGAGAPAVGTVLKESALAPLQVGGSLREIGLMGGLFERSHYVSGMLLTDGLGAPLGYVFAASDAQAMQVYLVDTMSAFVLSSLVVLFVASILAFVLANRTITPLRRIAVAAHSFAEGDYSARVPVEGDDELAQLAITFNEMANSFEATDTSRRSFMGNIAHELRTPMTTIKGFIDGMLDGTIPPQQRDKYLAVVSDEVGRLARLTKNMLDISRLEAGEYTANLTTFDLWGPLTTVFLSAEQRLSDKGLLVEGLGHNSTAMVLADADFVHQVLFNLVDNAIKFANDGGTITASVRVEKNEVTACVHNTGAGIAQDALNHVFDRFFKADKSRGVNARGAGLGLHISKVLVGLMGGRIWAESKLGEYSAFFFSLPAAPPPKKPRRGDSKKMPAAKGDAPPQEKAPPA